MFEGLNREFSLFLGAIRSNEAKRLKFFKVLSKKYRFLSGCVQRGFKYSNVVVLNGRKVELESSFFSLYFFKKELINNGVDVRNFHDFDSFKVFFILVLKRSDRKFFLNKNLFTDVELEFFRAYLSGDFSSARDNICIAEFLNLNDFKNQWRVLVNELFDLIKKFRDFLFKDEKNKELGRFLDGYLKELSLKRDLEYSFFCSDSLLVDFFYRFDVLSRRDFLKLAIGGGLGLGATLGLGEVFFYFFMKNEEKKRKSKKKITVDDLNKKLLLDKQKSEKVVEDFLMKYYGKFLRGDLVVKGFSMPFFEDLKVDLGLNADLVLPKRLLYEQYKFKRRRRSKLKKTEVFTKPSKFIRKFVKDIYDEGYLENYYSKMGYGKAYFNYDCFEFFSFIALVSGSVEYVSDYSNATAVGTGLGKSLNRDLFEIYYDRFNYWKFPEQTLVDGFGDCEDFSILLVALVSVLWENKKNVDVGLARLWNKNSAHAIAGVKVVGIEFIETFLNHYTRSDFLKKSKLFPYIYVKSGTKLPYVVSKNSMAEKYNDLTEYIILFEPQKFYVNSANLDFEHYTNKVLYLDGVEYNLSMDWRRVYFDLSHVSNGLKFEKRIKEYEGEFFKGN